MKKFFKENWAYILIGLGILALYFIRLYHLTFLPVFADEAIYIRWSQVMSAEPTLRFLPLSDGKQPLYMWVLMFFVKRLPDPLFTGRILSVFSGLGTMIGIFAVSYLLFKNKIVSLISSLMWAVSPFSFFFDRMALVDSFLAMFGVWTMFFGILTAKFKRLDFAMITGFSLGFALLTKSPAIFFALLLPVVAIFLKNKKDIFKYAALLVATYVIAFGMYNIQRLGPNFQLLTSRTQDYVFPISHIWINPKDPFIFHIEQIFKDWFIKMGPWPILVLGFIGLLIDWKKVWREKLVLLVWFAFPILVQSMYAKVFTVRYILFTLPAFFILAATPILSKNKYIKIVSSIFLALFVILSLYFNYQLVTNPGNSNLPSSERSGYLEEWTSGTGIKEVADYIKSEHLKNPNEKIVIGTEGYFGTLPDGLQMYLEKVPNVIVIGTGLDFKDVPQSLKESFEFGNKTYFVVNSSRLKIKSDDFDEMGLKIVATYKKADRREKDTHEFIWYGLYDTFYFLEIIR